MCKTKLIASFVPVLMLPMGCASIQRPEVRSVHPRVTAIDFQGVSLVLDVGVHNPYPFALRAPRFDYGIDVESQEFMKSQSPVEVDLPPREVGTLSLPARFGYVELWRAYQALASAPEANYRLHATVPITVLGETVEVPVSHSGKLPILRPPSVAVDRVDFPDVSLSGAKVTADLTLGNPNAFALGVSKLGYELVLGDVPVGQLTASTLDKIGPGATGKLGLTGEITARSALARLLQKQGLGQPRVSPRGAIETPYGPVELGNRP